MTPDDIVRVCATVGEFSRMANWRWKALPIVEWEFPTISEFARARAQILQAVTPLMVYGENNWQRSMDANTLEIDCHGVTFRLVCRERMATPHGSYGAAEIIYTTLEDFEKRQKK